MIKINKDIFKVQLNKILKSVKKTEKICLLGLSFKEGTDDIRFSQPLKLARELIKKKYEKIILCDNLAFDNLKKNFGNKNIKVIKKPSYDKQTYYILCNKEDLFINFLKKIPTKQVIDLRYII